MRLPGVTPTGEQLATGVSTGWSGLSAGEADTGLTTGAVAVQGEGAGGTGSRVTDDITGVVTAGEQFTTGSPTLVLRAGAGPGTLGLATATALNAGLATGRTVPRVTGGPTLVRATAQCPPAGAATGPAS